MCCFWKILNFGVAAPLCVMSYHATSWLIIFLLVHTQVVFIPFIIARITAPKRLDDLGRDVTRHDALRVSFFFFFLSQKCFFSGDAVLKPLPCLCSSCRILTTVTAQSQAGLGLTSQMFHNNILTHRLVWCTPHC